MISDPTSMKSFSSTELEKWGFSAKWNTSLVACTRGVLRGGLAG